MPRRAILTVALGTTLWLGLGKGAILPIINMSTICITIIMILSLVALWRLRNIQPDMPEFVLPGGRATLVVSISAAALAAIVATISPFQRGESFPVEIVLLIGWAIAGIAFSFVRQWRG